MSGLALRRSTGLARLAGSSLSAATTRAALRTSPALRSFPRALAASPQLRYKSSDNKPQPPANDKHESSGKPQVQSSSSPGPAEDRRASGPSPPPLPEGWAYLSEGEVQRMEQMLDDVSNTMAGSMVDKRAIKVISVSGVPLELKQHIEKLHSGDRQGLPPISEMGKFFKAINAVSKRLATDVELQAYIDYLDKNPGTPPRQTPEAYRNAGQKTTEQFQDRNDEQQPKNQKNGQEQHNEGFRFNQNEEPRRQEGNQEGNQKPPPKPENKLPDWLTTVISTVIAYWLYDSIFGEGGSREITWQDLRKNFLDKGLVEKLVVEGRRVRVDLNTEATQSMYPDSVATRPGFNYYFSIGSVDSFERHVDEAQAELGIPSNQRIPIQYSGESSFMKLLLSFGPTLLVVGLLYYISRRGPGGGGSSGVFGMGKSRAKRFSHETAVKIKFDDVAGMDEAKQEIMEFVSFLKKPEKFRRLGAKIPRGAILAGPPGTGKTMIAKATAGESGVPFYSVSGSEFVEMFVGVGASRVRDLFAEARKSAPCIVFIDEIDAIGKSRSEGKSFSGGHDEREATLNQILTEMDGFNTTEQVVVLAGTNRVDILDKALMRPGRFDRHINIDMPTMKGRQDIFKVYLPKIKMDGEIEYLSGRLATLTPGFAGADIANCVNEAALIAARSDAPAVTLKHFEQAIERVIGGLERKSLVLQPKEKKVVAYHEAGHAICGWYFRHADPLLKVSIIPRGKGLGYAQYLPGDMYLMNRDQLMDRMAMTLGGRISEELHFPQVTSGGADDFDKVTKMATAMVTQWGMSEKLGTINYTKSNNDITKPFAETTGQLIDEEIKRIVSEAYKQCKDLLIAKQKEVGIVAEELLSKEVLVRDDMVRLLGQRPFDEPDDFSHYFGGKKKTADGQDGGSPPPSAGAPESSPPTPPPSDGGSPAPALFQDNTSKAIR